MPFLTQEKTNLKYVLIVVILAVIVGGGILVYQYWWLPKSEIKIPEIKMPEKVIKDETASWKTYKNEEYGFEFKIPFFFENIGYKISEDESSHNQNIFFVGECDVVIFKTKPIPPLCPEGMCSEEISPENLPLLETYQPMLIVQICPKEYCELAKTKEIWKGIDICQALRERREELEEIDDYLFATYITENEKYIVYLGGGPSSGDFSNAMGWEKEEVKEAQKQLLSTFRLLE